MQRQTKIPTDAAIIQFLENSDYKMNIPGICFGLANMGMRAIVLEGNHLNEFKNTLSLLDSFISQKEPSLEEIEKMTIIKGEPPKDNNTDTLYLQIQNNKKLIAHYPNGLKKSTENPQLVKHLSSVIADKEQCQITGLSAQGVLGKLTKIPVTTLTLNDMLPSEHKDKIKKLFDNILKFQHAQEIESYQLALAEPIDGEKLLLHDTILGMYSTDQLKTFLNLLKEETERPECGSFAFSLSMEFHSIMIGYNAVNNEWYCINSHKSIGENITPISFNDIFAKLIRTFGCSKWHMLTSQLIGDEKTRKNTEDLLSRLKNKEKWQQLHEITDEKSTASDETSPGYTFLLCAAREGDLTAINSILQTKNIKDIINQPYHDVNSGTICTPISLAITRGNVDVVKALLNTNLINDTQKIYSTNNVKLDILGFCDRYSAAPNHDEIFELLLEYRNRKQQEISLESSYSASSAHTALSLESIIDEINSLIKQVNIATCSTDETTQGVIENILENMSQSLNRNGVTSEQKLEFSRMLFDNLTRTLKAFELSIQAETTSIFTPSITSEEFKDIANKISIAFESCAHLLKPKQSGM